MSESLRPDGILFDIGMTLVHPDGAVLVEELETVGVTGVDSDDAVAALQMSCAASHMRLPAHRDVVERTALSFAAALDIPAKAAVVALGKALVERDLYRSLDPGASATLKALREAGFALGVVSNSDGTLLEELDRWALREYFDVIVDSTIAGFHKPTGEIFELALSQLGLPAEACWYVGDDLVNDVIGGLAAGFETVVLYDRLDLYRHIPGVRRITELAELVPLATGDLDHQPFRRH